MKDKEIHLARAAYYGWLAVLFGYIKEENTLGSVVENLEIFATNPLEEKSKDAIDAMRVFLKTKGNKGLKEESDLVFYSFDTSMIPMSASYYDEQRDDGKKRLDTIEILLESPFRRDTFTCKDSEDHIALLFQLMSMLVLHGVEQEEVKSLELAEKLFETILNPFIDTFIALVFTHEATDFYKHVAVVLQGLVEFERFYLQVAAPKYEEVLPHIMALEQKDRKPFSQKARRNPDEITL
ncbi:MAG: molecular chaperone TorD family protein [Campylobacterales bacterium]|nr:molecular chaperone TorD family protein [Campylobacterales bacterium]